MPAKPPAGRTLYYPVIVAAGRKSGWAWGKPCDTDVGAWKLVKAECVENGHPMGFVVKFGPDGPEVVNQFTYPMSARRVIEKWEALWDALEREHPEAFGD